MGIIDAIILTALGIAIGFILRVIIADNKEYFTETFAELSASKMDGIRSRTERTNLLCDNIPAIKKDVEWVKNQVEFMDKSINGLHYRLGDTHIGIPVLQKLMSYERFFKEYKNENREEYTDKFDVFRFMLNADLCKNGLWVKFEDKTNFVHFIDVYPSQNPGVGMVFAVMQSNECPMMFTEQDIYRMDIKNETGCGSNCFVLMLYLKGSSDKYESSRPYRINAYEMEACHKECVKEMLLTALHLQEKEKEVVE